jgi:hypothetical protein
MKGLGCAALNFINPKTKIKDTRMLTKYTLPVRKAEIQARKKYAGS